MAHNTRVRADLGAWSTAVPVEPSEFYALDGACFEAVNGDKGGIWNPTSVIKIGGAGLVLNGVHYIDINSELRATYSGAKITLANGGKLQVDAGGTVDLGTAGTILSSGGSLSGTFGGSRQFNGNTTFAGPAYIANGGQISSAVTIEPTYGHLSGRISEGFLVGPDADSIIDSRIAGTYLVQSLTADRVYTLGHAVSAPARHGDLVRFKTNVAAYAITFVSGMGGGIFGGAAECSSGLKFNYSGNFATAIEYCYSDGLAGHPAKGWHVVAYTKMHAAL